MYRTRTNLRRSPGPSFCWQKDQCHWQLLNLCFTSSHENNPKWAGIFCCLAVLQVRKFINKLSFPLLSQLINFYSVFNRNRKQLMYFVHAGELFPSSVSAICLYHLLVIHVFKKKKNGITYLDNLMILLIKSGGAEILFTKKLITSTCVS